MWSTLRARDDTRAGRCVNAPCSGQGPQLPSGVRIHDPSHAPDGREEQSRRPVPPYLEVPLPSSPPNHAAVPHRPSEPIATGVQAGAAHAEALVLYGNRSRNCDYLSGLRDPPAFFARLEVDSNVAPLAVRDNEQGSRLAEWSGTHGHGRAPQNPPGPNVHPRNGDVPDRVESRDGSSGGIGDLRDSHLLINLAVEAGIVRA